MLKLTLLSLLMLFANSALAVTKSGTILLDGKVQVVSIKERAATGTITVGDQTFKVMGSGPKEVTGLAIEKVNGVKTKDLNVLIKFQIFAEEDLKELVDNKLEVKCDDQANSIVLISDNLTDAVIGNCANLIDANLSDTNLNDTNLNDKK